MGTLETALATVKASQENLTELESVIANMTNDAEERARWLRYATGERLARTVLSPPLPEASDSFLKPAVTVAVIDCVV